jgi:hypothetical protein
MADSNSANDETLISAAESSAETPKRKRPMRIHRMFAMIEPPAGTKVTG